MLEMD